jgi:C1A family cysteine protease
MAFCIRYLSIRNSRDPSNFLTNPERLDPSRFYIYYHSRLLGASPSQPAAGATLSDTVLAVEKYGCCSESRWGYDIKRSAQQPSPECYREALDPSACEYKACSGANRNPYAYVFKHLQPTDILSKHKGFSWVSSSPGRELVNEFCRSLLNNTPILYAFALDKSYDHHIVGFVPMPDVATFKATSGHAVAIVGYGNYNASEPGAKYFKFINSAGPSWGHSGYGYLPEEYVTRTGLLSLEGYAINMPRVTTTVTVSRAVCTPARSRPITYGPRRAH